MPLYDFHCDYCDACQSRIYGTLDDAKEDERRNEDFDCPDGCGGTLTRTFPTANFQVRGGTPRHH